jgi:hypothetical protein
MNNRFDLDAKPEGPKGVPGRQLDFERKDAWYTSIRYYPRLHGWY